MNDRDSFLYKRVRLTTGAYAPEGAVLGALGYVIECHDYDAFEVEFSKPETGETYALLTLRSEEFVLDAE
jgi:Domain of unknown function (DUF4926)